MKTLNSLGISLGDFFCSIEFNFCFMDKYFFVFYFIIVEICLKTPFLFSQKYCRQECEFLILNS